MKISTKVKLALRAMLLKAASVETEQATLLYDGELEVGTEVFVEDENGEVVPAADGEYKSGDSTYVVKEGKIAEIRTEETKEETTEEVESAEEPEAEPADEPESTTEETETEEDRIANLEKAVADIREGIEALTNAIAALADRMAAAEDKLKGLEAPAAEPAEEGEEKEEKFASKLNYLKRKK